MPVPKQARDYTYQEIYRNQSNYGYLNQRYPQSVVATPIRPQTTPKIRPAKPVQRKKKANPFAKLIQLAFIASLAIFVLPYSYDRISKPLLFGNSYSEVRVDETEFINPTRNYLSNDLFLNTRLLAPAKIKKPEMTTLYKTERMPLMEAQLKKLMLQYPSIDASVFVWDYDSGKYVDLKASQPYSAASIIKIPILIRLFKSIEANQLTIYDEMTLTEYYRSSGSGDMQYKQAGTKYTVDQLARLMITQSDNTATNMIMSAIGAMPDVNGGIRSWGLKNTYVNNWLPDLEGTNYTTAKDLATMLYNLDNPGFLNINSREYIVDYMSHVENNRLIQAGLGQGALFVHKTGDIGKMLGDAGIVFTPAGKKYICVILANRPYDSPLGKDFIQKASKLIYDNMTIKGGY